MLVFISKAVLLLLMSAKKKSVKIINIYTAVRNHDPQTPQSDFAPRSELEFRYCVSFFAVVDRFRMLLYVTVLGTQSSSIIELDQ